MARIRKDLVGVVSVSWLNLAAGDEVPAGVIVGEHVLDPDSTEPVDLDIGVDEAPVATTQGEPVVEPKTPEADEADEDEVVDPELPADAPASKPAARPRASAKK